MRRALLLLLLALVAAGCGRTYSKADVARALGGGSPGFDVGGRRETGPRPFATWAAVTELRMASGTVVAESASGSDTISIFRYASRHDAWVATNEQRLIYVVVVVEGQAPGPRDVVRHENLVLIGSRPEIDAAIARLDH